MLGIESDQLQEGCERPMGQTYGMILVLCDWINKTLSTLFILLTRWGSNMHEMLKALSPGSEVTAKPGDVDELTNQGWLPGFVLHSWFYTGIGDYTGENPVCMSHWILSKGAVDVPDSSRWMTLTGSKMDGSVKVDTSNQG